MNVGAIVQFNGDTGVVLAVTDQTRRDWEGVEHPEWPRKVRVRWGQKGRESWFAPELLTVLAIQHDSECESRRDIHLFGGRPYCATCGGAARRRDVVGRAG